MRVRQEEEDEEGFLSANHRPNVGFSKDRKTGATTRIEYWAARKKKKKKRHFLVFFSASFASMGRERDD